MDIIYRWLKYLELNEYPDREYVSNTKYINMLIMSGNNNITTDLLNIMVNNNLMPERIRKELIFRLKKYIMLDIEIVVSQSNKTSECAYKLLLENNGDLIDAIVASNITTNLIDCDTM